jgi:hypothetical protein
MGFILLLILFALLGLLWWMGFWWLDIIIIGILLISKFIWGKKKYKETIVRDFLHTKYGDKMGDWILNMVKRSNKYDK